MLRQYQGISYGFDLYLGIMIIISLLLPHYRFVIVIATVATFLHYEFSENIQFLRPLDSPNKP